MTARILAASPAGSTSVLIETSLLVLPGAVLLAGVGALALSLSLTLSREQQGLLVLVALLPVVTPSAVALLGRRWDRILGGSVWMLCALSVIVVARVAPDTLSRQLLWIVLGWIVLLAIVALPDVLGALRRYHYTWLACGLALAVATLLFGEDLNGSGIRLWIRVGPLTLQPSELLRVLLVVFLAAYLDARRDLLTSDSTRIGPLRLPPLPDLWPLLAMAGLSMLILTFQRDLGPAMLYFGSFIAVVYLATGRRSYVVLGVALFALGGAVGYLASSHVHGRFEVWIDPWSDSEGLGYQSLQALGGLAFGGIAGAGPGYGHPSLVPAAQTDYPVVVIAEEWGLIGFTALLLLYAIVTLRLLAISSREAQGRFPQLLAAGLGVSFGLQVIIIIAGALRLIPVAGITSPFLSYGGSSMLAGWSAIALVTAMLPRKRSSNASP